MLLNRDGHSQATLNSNFPRGHDLAVYVLGKAGLCLYWPFLAQRQERSSRPREVPPTLAALRGLWHADTW